MIVRVTVYEEVRIMVNENTLNTMVGIFVKTLFVGFPLACAGAAIYEVAIHGFGSMVLLLAASILGLFLGLHLVRIAIILLDEAAWTTGRLSAAAVVRVKRMVRRAAGFLPAPSALSEA